LENTPIFGHNISKNQCKNYKEYGKKGAVIVGAQKQMLTTIIKKTSTRLSLHGKA
jgi:hypothetical protein